MGLDGKTPSEMIEIKIEGDNKGLLYKMLLRINYLV
jgi:hypothetical protein